MLPVGHAHECRSHVIASASARTRKGEPLASEFIHSLPDKSVTLLDKRLLRCRPVAAYSGRRHRPSLAHPERKGLVYPELLSAMATVTVCCTTVSPSGSQEKTGVADTLQVRAVTYEVAGKENGLYLLPWRIQRNSGSDPVPRGAGNRAGIPGYQKARCSTTPSR